MVGPDRRLVARRPPVVGVGRGRAARIAWLEYARAVLSTMPLRRVLARWSGFTLIGGVVIGALFSARGGVTLASFALSAAISTVYSGSIGLPVMLGIRAVEPRVAGRSGTAQWVAYLGVLFAATAVGALVAGLVLVAVGLQALDDLGQGYLRGVQIALAIAGPVTLGAGTYARLQSRLVATEASLHAKQLEHQRALALASEARLASLESRVRPHFLFNALNSAIALIPEDPRRAEQVLERLASLLRSSLDGAAATVTLGDELRVVVDYLEIERVRFVDRLRYQIDVPADVRGAILPAFAVQTVVENSVKYAVSARRAGATIVVRAGRAHGRVRLEITDDGPGFAGPIWLPGHGLDGLRARLDALYGGAARLVVPSEVAVGAGVTIELPEVAA